MHLFTSELKSKACCPYNFTSIEYDPGSACNNENSNLIFSDKGFLSSFTSEINDSG